MARAFVAAGAWAPDGGLHEEDVVRTLAFFSNETLRRASPANVVELRFFREARAATER